MSFRQARLTSIVAIVSGLNDLDLLTVLDMVALSAILDGVLRYRVSGFFTTLVSWYRARYVAERVHADYLNPTLTQLWKDMVDMIEFQQKHR